MLKLVSSDEEVDVLLISHLILQERSAGETTKRFFSVFSVVAKDECSRESV